MPRANWSFYLLSSLNVAVALVGVWMLAGLFLDSLGRMTAVLLIALTPSFSIWALKYNANAPLISIWPWTTYFFLKSFQTRGTGWSIAAGALAAAALLTKYSSVVLFATLLLAAAFHEGRRLYFASPAPYVSLAVGCCLAAPHFVWATTTGFTGIQYVLSKKSLLQLDVHVGAIKSIAALIGSLGVAAAAFIIAFGRQAWELFTRALAATFKADNLWLACLAWGPLALTVALSFVTEIALNWNYLIPVFFATPIAFLVLSRAVVTPAILARLALCIVTIGPAALAVSAAFAYNKLGSASPRKEAAIAATTLWRDAFGTPLPCVSGNDVLAQAATFYSSDAPSYVSARELAARYKRCGGMVIICEATQEQCAIGPKGVLGQGISATRMLTARHRNGTAELQQFVFVLYGPQD